MIFYVKASEAELSERKLESYLRYSQIIQWGRKYPTRFVERFYGIVLSDFQKYLFMNTWTKQTSVWCITRNGGKSFLSAPFIMAKSNLFPKHQSHILAGGAGRQAQETFRKIEQIAKKELASAIGLTDFFMGEIKTSPTNKNGFIHNPASWSYELYNGSRVNTLNSAIDNNRGFRSNLILFDESGFSPDEMFEAIMPFLTQNADFKVGANVSVDTIAKNIPNQAIFISSASNMSTYFYKKYKETAKLMIMGDPSVFIADINADMVMSATFDGKLPAEPLLKQSLIDGEMKINKAKALREFYNKFDLDGGEKQPFKRSTIEKFAQIRKPELKRNHEEDCVYVFAYDPARMHDNSVFTVGKLYQDPEVGYKMDIVNSITFADIGKKKKTPMDYLNQKKEIRQLLLDYNGDFAADYEFVERMLVDEGSGGAGVPMVDTLAENFKDKKGKTHKGIVDRKHREKDTIMSKSAYPDAIDLVTFMSPTKYKREMFDSLLEMINYGYLTFPEYYDGKDQLTYYESVELDEPIEYENEDGEIVVDKYESQLREIDLNEDEKISLININLAKEELYNMYVYEGTNDSYRYDLAPDKKNEYDDRAYTVAMLGWYLKQKRKKEFAKAGRKQISYTDAPIFVSTFTL